MHSWVPDLLLFESGLFLVAMASCFVAGMCSRAHELRREQMTAEISGMSDERLRAELFSFRSRYPSDLLFDERQRRLRSILHEHKRAEQTLPETVGGAQELGAVETADGAPRWDETVLYADNVAYLKIKIRMPSYEDEG